MMDFVSNHIRLINYICLLIPTIIGLFLLYHNQKLGKINKIYFIQLGILVWFVFGWILFGTRTSMSHEEILITEYNMIPCGDQVMVYFKEYDKTLFIVNDNYLLDNIMDVNWYVEISYNLYLNDIKSKRLFYYKIIRNE